MYQEIAWSVTVLISAFLVGVFIYVVSQSATATEYEPVRRAWGKVRSVWFWVLVVSGVVVSISTLMILPYPLAGFSSAPAAPTREIEATGHQWYWDLDSDKAKVGETVEFVIKSADVNHGFGLYDESLRLLIQAQAMPGYVNRIRFRFESPGTYKVLCLEYCGLTHHDMSAEITVTAN